jgi:uncharacterized protein (UPF0332 family)
MSNFAKNSPSLAELIKRGDVKPFKAEPTEVASLIEIAERDLKRAQRDFDEDDLDWTLAVSYNALLQAARAWMFFKGYRPSFGEGHLIIIHFAVATLEKSFGDEILVLDVLRKKRHVAIYEHAGSVTEFEAKHAIETAKRFVAFVKEKTGVK